MKKITLLISFLLLYSAIYAQPLSGAYTINSGVVTGGTNFQSFADFATSINLNGISSSVTVTVAPGSGPYNEQVVIENVQGTSASATVTIDGSNEMLTALTTSTDRHILRLHNLSYFTVTNLHIKRDTSAASGFQGIHIYESGNHITISNCVVDMTGSISSLVGGIIASDSTTSNLSGGDFSDITFTNDTTIGGGFGASVFGLPTLAHHIVISDNTFYDFTSNGIYIRETDSVVISGNYLDKRTAQVTSNNAIQIAQAANINAQIYNNKIRVSQVSNGSQNFRGIYLFDGTGHKVYNNDISQINLESGSFTAIEVRTGGTSPEIYFNTISIDKAVASTGDFFGVKESLTNTGTKLLNNMINITQPTTGLSAAIGLAQNSTVASAIISNYNNLYVPNGAVALRDVLNAPVFFNTLSDWNTASTQDANSLSLDPQFISPTSLVPANAGLDNMGTTVNYVPVDLPGNLRSIPPDMGAYEFIITGIEESKRELSYLQPYPNPVANFFRINTKEKCTVQLIDVSGKMIRQQEIEPERNEMYTADLAAGSYLVAVITGNSVARFKIVKK
jgi:hypothetical protein